MNWHLLILSWSALTLYGLTLWATIWYANKAADWKDKYEDVQWLNDALIRARDARVIEEAERYLREVTEFGDFPEWNARDES